MLSLVHTVGPWEGPGHTKAYKGPKSGASSTPLPVALAAEGAPVWPVLMRNMAVPRDLCDITEPLLRL